MADERRHRRALVLSGGGARGAYEAGVVSALAQTERFDIVCGTSIGALNAMFIAQSREAELPDLWRQIVLREVARLKPEVAALVRLWEELQGVMSASLAQRVQNAMSMFASIPGLRNVAHLFELRGFFDSAAVRSFVEEHADLPAVDKTFIVSVTNLNDACSGAFGYFPAGSDEGDTACFFREHDAEPITAENYVDAVLASAALPPAYDPVEIRCQDGVVRAFADGFATNNTPFRQAIDAGATEITAILVDPLEPTVGTHEVKTLAHVGSIMLDANYYRMLQLDLKLVQRINEDVRNGWSSDKRHVDIRLICPQQRLSVKTLDFSDLAVIEHLLERGRSDGERATAAAASG